VTCSIRFSFSMTFPTLKLTEKHQPDVRYASACGHVAVDSTFTLKFKRIAGQEGRRPPLSIQSDSTLGESSTQNGQRSDRFQP